MAPNDGHKKTILDPHATHVGIGVAWEGGEFRLVHEFVRRYVSWKRPPPRPPPRGGEQRPLREGPRADARARRQRVRQLLAPRQAPRLPPPPPPGLPHEAR